MEIKIASLNLHDDLINFRGGIDGDIDRVKILTDLIKKEKFDFVGTQEMTKKVASRFVKMLSNYKLYGNHRIIKTSLIDIPFDEANTIITNKEVSYTKTYKLPWLPEELKNYSLKNIGRIIPRICTIVINDELNICMINTHLDYFFPKIQKKQLIKLKEIINEYKDKYKIILTGDFNMETSDVDFKDFNNKLKADGISRVEINASTFKDLKNGREAIIDHIFIPSNWEVIESGVINDSTLHSITDHKGIFVKVKTK